MQTIGERLEEARKKKGISIREAAEATKIRGDYLSKFESNQFDIGLTEIYTRGFLRSYANYLKLPAERILSDYAALGRGEVRPRQPSREIYGRMDISVSSAGESSDRAAPPEEGAAAEPAPGPARAQPRYPRGSGPALPSGPDPALVFKYLKWGGIVVIVLLVGFVLKALFTSNTPATPPARPTVTSPATTAPSRPPVRGLSYTLVAKDVLQVRVSTVTRDLSEDPNAAEIQDLFNGILQKGERQIIPLDGPQKITFSEGRNLGIEWQGSPLPFNQVGPGFQAMNVPASMRGGR